MSQPKPLKTIEIVAIVISVVIFLIFSGIIAYSPSALSFFTHTIPEGVMTIMKHIGEFFSTVSTDKELGYSYLKYFLLYGVVITMAVIYLLNAKDNELFLDLAIFKNPAFYFSLSIIIPLIIIFFFILPYLRGGGINRNAIIGAIIIFSFAMTLFFLYTNLTPEQLNYVTWTLTGIFALIAINALAIFFYIFGNYLKTLTGWSGFIVYFIFYLPCLFLNFIEYLKAEFKATPNTVYILFIIEIILILLYNYAPYLINKTLNSTGKVLLKSNVFLNKEYTIAKGDEFKVKKTQKEEDTTLTTFNQNYSVSMWTYLNVQPNNFKAYSSETTIFDYGNGKPKITYNYDLSNNYAKNKYRIYFTDEDNKNAKNYYEFTMLDQKWNNIVVNYRSTSADLFINGNIEKTFYFKDNFAPPRYFLDDTIIVGSNGGLHGSICNVKYFFRPQTKFEIANNYNILASSNPPIYMEE
jgi:hypothetical protein